MRMKSFCLTVLLASLPVLTQAQLAPKSTARPTPKTGTSPAQAVYDSTDALMKLLCSPESLDPNISPNRRKDIYSQAEALVQQVMTKIRQLKVQEDNLRLDVPHELGAVSIYASVALVNSGEICSRQPVKVGGREVPVPAAQGAWAYVNGTEVDPGKARECGTKVTTVGENAFMLGLALSSTESAGVSLAMMSGLIPGFYDCLVPKKAGTLVTLWPQLFL